MYHLARKRQLRAKGSTSCRDRCVLPGSITPLSSQCFKPSSLFLSFFKVRELTETLERSLNFGSAVKKPAGGVSLHFQGNGNDNSEPPRATAQQSSGRKVKSMRAWENSPFMLYSTNVVVLLMRISC